MKAANARTSRTAAFWRCLWLALVVAAALPRISVAVEPAEDFLKGLQERRLNELALDYLESMKTSQAVDEKFRKKIPYHRGVVLVEQSRQSADPAVRDRLMEEARVELEQFAQANPRSVEGAEAQLQLASLQLARGQQVVSQLEQLPAGATYDRQRRTQGREARVLFANARETFEAAEAIYSAELEKLPPTTTETTGAAGNLRQEYRARVAQLRFLAAQTQFEAAQTYPAAADEFRELHEAAAEELSAVYEEFARTLIVGLYARLYEGRCYQATGEYQLALGAFEDVLAQPNVLPPFRKLIASARRCQAECFMAQEKYDAAIDAAKASLSDAKSDEEKQSEWLGVRYRLAQALQKKSDSAVSGSVDQRRLLAEARDAYRTVAGVPGEFQSAARTAMLAVAGTQGEKKDEPRTFQAAYDAGKDALASYNAARMAMPAARENNPDAVSSLEAQMAQGKEDARRYFLAATTLVEDDTDPKLLNEVRYFLCWLYWESEDYYRAAVLGEFLARRFPDHSAAASAAKLSMASFERLYAQAAAKGGNKTDTEFEARKMASMAEFMTRRWPGTEDADAAQSVLVNYAIRNNRIEEAEKLLAEASEKTRPRLELQLGNAMWGRYIELTQPGQNEKPSDDALKQLRESALKYLRNGIKTTRDEKPTSDLTAAASLYLVQALLSEEKYDDAIAALEDDRIGPLALMEKKQTAAARPQYAIEAYRAALRAYVLVTPPRDEKALEIMKSLEAAVAAVGGNEDQLTQAYIGLGMLLEKQVTQLREAGREDEAKRINMAVAQFLDRIAERQTAANWPTRVWLAQTYYNLGNERRIESNAAMKPLSKSSRAYLEKSRDAYQQLLTDAAKDPKLAPSETSLLAARMQLGECLRALGQYQAALDTFSLILKDKESWIAAQRAAAYAYQERGIAENAKWFENAIHGGYRLKKTGQNRIWGWLKLSTVAARAARSDPKYRDTFYEARANVARCRYLAALKQQGAARKQDLAKAKQSIQSVAQVYPDLGGEKWRAEFDALLKLIQAAAGEKPDGLREFSAGQTATSRQPKS